MSASVDPRLADNLRRWTESGQPRRWVESRCGGWNHTDWLILLGNLRHTEFWPMDPCQVGATLERLQRERANLRRWTDSGQARLWVESHRGAWGQADLHGLLGALRQSEFWPLDAAAVTRSLEGLQREWWNLRLWQDSGEPRAWVEAHRGAWGHADWLGLLDSLQRSEYWPLNPSAVGELLEGLKARYWNLRRWRESGQALAWVEARQGRWTHPDWLALLAELRLSEFWPLQPDAAGQVLEELRQQWRNLRRWVESGQPHFWVASHEGRWGHEDWLALLDGLRASDFWPLCPQAVGRVLERLKARAPAALPFPATGRESVPVVSPPSRRAQAA